MVYHSVFNAISSALGLHSIGFYFPNNDQKEKNRDSRHYLEYAKKLLTEAEAKIGNLSIVIECKVPRIEPLVLPMRQSLAAVLGINVDQISIIATSGENVTPWGQGVGVEVLSSVLIEMKQ